MHSLAHHPLPRAIHTRADLRVFMEHHVFAVWDFMVLLKALQHQLAPSGTPWLPSAHPRLVGLIHGLVHEEECDCLPVDLGGPRHLSHFMIYRSAMREIGADVSAIDTFLAMVASDGLEPAMGIAPMPAPARSFLASTQALIAAGQRHELAAAFAYGRERLVPDLFRALRDQILALDLEAPLFLWYLRRHIELDGEEHGPMAEQLVLELCEGDGEKLDAAARVRKEVIADRRRFWDGVHACLRGRASGCEVSAHKLQNRISGEISGEEDHARWGSAESISSVVGMTQPPESPGG